MNLYTFLIGDLQISRDLDGDHFFSGVGSFRAHEATNNLCYHEEGVANHPSGYSSVATRSYYFCIHQNDLGFSVYFDSARSKLFHRIILSSNGMSKNGVDSHRCSRDLYVSRYRFPVTGDWTWEVFVKGPNKKYSMLSRYQRKLGNG